MGKQITKTEVIEKTIEVLESICVPVKLKEQILEPIEGAIHNLAIVIQMEQAEKEMREKEAKAETAPAEEEEAGENGPETDAE